MIRHGTRTKPIRNSDPLVRQLFDMISTAGLTQIELAARVGTHQAVICHWKHRSSPTLALFSAAVQAAGGRLVILPLDTPCAAAKLVRGELRE